jgi:hypothetical protein
MIVQRLGRHWGGKFNKDLELRGESNTSIETEHGGDLGVRAGKRELPID